MFEASDGAEEGAGFYDAADTFAITPTERELRNQGYVATWRATALHLPDGELAAHWRRRLWTKFRDATVATSTPRPTRRCSPMLS